MTPAKKTRPLSRRGRTKLTCLTIGGIAACIAVALPLNLVIFRDEPAGVLEKAFVSATLIPVVLAGPLFVFISLKLRQLSLLTYELKRLATRDSLTKLLNRGAFSNDVESRLLAMRRSGTGSGALLLIDADFFKSINDRWGHATGDAVLREIAQRLQGVIREGDLIGRLGGEEFAVFLAGADRTVAAATAERLRQVIAEMRLASICGAAMRVTVSVGGIFFRGDVDFQLLYQSADRKLYDAKSKGRNRVEIEAVEEVEEIVPEASVLALAAPTALA